jgi:hypothetical protein
MFRACLRDGHGKRAFCGKPRCARLSRCALLRLVLLRRCEGERVSGKKVATVSCEDCFFKRNMLCALSCDSPCPTFRPDHPDGLRPPQQLRFVFRQERRRQAAWAFPSAQEQAALHR